MPKKHVLLWIEKGFSNDAGRMTLESGVGFSNPPHPELLRKGFNNNRLGCGIGIYGIKEAPLIEK